MLVVVNMGEDSSNASYIISKESSKLKFTRWTYDNREYKNKLFMFKILASVDISTLYILNSNLAGSSFFRLPFSEDAQARIFQGVFWNILTEDIPRVIIQVGK